MCFGLVKKSFRFLILGGEFFYHAKFFDHHRQILINSLRLWCLEPNFKKNLSLKIFNEICNFLPPSTNFNRCSGMWGTPWHAKTTITIHFLISKFEMTYADISRNLKFRRYVGEVYYLLVRSYSITRFFRNKNENTWRLQSCRAVRCKRKFF